MKGTIAALLLLCPLSLTAAGAEMLESSLRPLVNPLIRVETAAAVAAVPQIGPALPHAPAAKLAAIAAPPVNPRLGVITASSSDRAPGADTGLPQIGEMLPASLPEPSAAAPVALAAIGPVLPALPAPTQPPAAKTVPTTADAAAPNGPRPRSRPAAVEKAAAAAKAAPAIAEASAPGTGAALLLTSLRPKQRPAAIVQLASAPVPAPAPEASPAKESGKGKKKSKEPASVKGSVCGVAAIKGEKIAPITSKVQGCGLEDGVRVTSVSGVRLSMAATIDCATAKALNTWVERVAQPAYGQQITELQIAGHYVCRPRNNKKGAKVSEHGRGKAIDVSGFLLASGKVIRVLGGFDKTMRQAHKGACGIFGTTLGPGSDGYHEDHLHFDTAAHRSGAYCR